MEERLIDYQNVADYFIALSNVTGNLISNPKFQKLMYYAQAWHLALFDHRLFDGAFEAWAHGPVLPRLYHEYEKFSWKPVEREDLTELSIHYLESTLGERVTEFLSEIVEEYFGLTTYELERLTHKEDPWRRARQGLNADEPCNRIIQDEWMAEFYKKFTVQEV